MPDSLTLDTLKAELAALELRIVDRITRELDKKADRSHVEALERDLENIKVHGSPALINTQRTMLDQAKEIGELRREQVARAHYIPIVDTLQSEVATLKRNQVSETSVREWLWRLVLALPGVGAVVALVNFHH